MSGYAVGSVDIKTVFLNAPAGTPNAEKVIVRAPGVMRQAGVCTEKYWLVRKALYGLDVASKSWTIHRNASLRGIQQLLCGKRVECKPMDADSNIWKVRCKDRGELICYLGLYVDDVLLVGPKEERKQLQVCFKNCGLQLKNHSGPRKTKLSPLTGSRWRSRMVVFRAPQQVS